MTKKEYDDELHNERVEMILEEARRTKAKRTPRQRMSHRRILIKPKTTGTRLIGYSGNDQRYSGLKPR